MQVLSPDLSIIIVCWNTRELLARCVQSVTSSVDERAGVQSVTLEVFVVDNASSDGSPEIVRERYPWVRLIENRENVGFARANNQGIAQATGRYILLLNPDTEVRSGALETLLAFMDAHARAGACGARLLNVDGTLQSSAQPMLTPGREFWRLVFLDGIWPRATYPMHRWDTTTPRRVEVIKGACLLLRREALDQIDTLDDSYFMYTEEVDLCYRLAQAGWELWYLPAAAVTHCGGASSRQVRDEMYLQLFRSKVRFYRKYGGEARARRFKLYVRMAYWPRWIAAMAAVEILRDRAPAVARQATTFHHVLAEIGSM